MRSRFIRYFIVTIIIYWLAYTFLIITFKTLSGKEFEIINITLTGLYTSIPIVGFIALGTYLALKPKFNFLESSEVNEPKFSSNIKGYYKNIHLPFEKLKSQIEQKWIITHTNKDEKVIKCFKRLTFFNWGYGAYLKYDETNHILNCIFFPLNTSSYSKNKFLTDFDKLIGNSFESQFN